VLFRSNLRLCHPFHLSVLHLFLSLLHPSSEQIQEVEAGTSSMAEAFVG
jgi:hypothetical protein